MDLYFIRHGIAQESHPDIADSDRPLTPKGQDKTRRIAQRLQQIGVEFDLILTSPLVRAHQTAQILWDRGLAPYLELFDPLAPDQPITDGLTQLTEQYSQRSKRCLALVGHQPDLSNWAEYLVFGASQQKLILKKAGLIGVTLPHLTPHPAQGQLFLLAGPRWLL